MALALGSIAAQCVLMDGAPARVLRADMTSPRMRSARIAVSGEVFFAGR